ncbi:hypothetical protein SAMN05444166_4444 [Singulisphaera sp. GP187]|uniref:hypothetical protein n=1 Tax=Singulisphaera sp. GP187 TaxID=1882752 RepID=UPI0009259A93|nr:hypothetical protein [Singulisphaera sp. GP187]SIO40651.1 hypothetical protein SAMN05444166_4444 [Singulisphaera sp. GP187]
MRCADVIHELAAPTGGLEQAVLSEHLENCPSCARWVERNARLGQIWDATRAPELSAVAWDRIWANVSESLDQPRVTVPAPSAPVIFRSWRRSAVVVFALAQAAAILAGLGLAWHHAPSPLRSPTPSQPRSVAVAPTPVVPVSVPAPDPGTDPALVAALDVSDMVFNLPSTGTSVISLDDKTLRNLALNGNPYEVDPLFNGFNDLESQAGLQ